MSRFVANSKPFLVFSFQLTIKVSLFFFSFHFKKNQYSLTQKIDHSQVPVVIFWGLYSNVSICLFKCCIVIVKRLSHCCVISVTLLQKCATQCKQIQNNFRKYIGALLTHSITPKTKLTNVLNLVLLKIPE